MGGLKSVPIRSPALPRTTGRLDPVPMPADLAARMTAWRRAHPTATFAEMEREATRQVAALRAELIAVALAASEPETAPTCRTCGGPMARVGERTRTVTTKWPGTRHRHCGTLPLLGLWDRAFPPH